MKVSIDDAILAEKNVNTLMGDNIVIRKEWINANINFDPE
jgi:topoisomerase-4 subunit B